MTAARLRPSAPRPSRALREAVLRRDGYRCTVAGCGRTHLLTVDHIKPGSHGGNTTYANLRTYCHLHNSARRAPHPVNGRYVK
jgi:5-methylcytosine-specific restriction endonuclease McrA